MTEPYWGNVLQSFENGVQLDLRVKLAVDFLKAPNMVTGSSAPVAAGFALDLATELLAEAERRGLMKALPEGDELNGAVRAHIRRNVRAQVYQQLQAQRIGPEEQPAVQPINGLPHGMVRQ